MAYFISEKYSLVKVKVNAFSCIFTNPKPIPHVCLPLFTLSLYLFSRQRVVTVRRLTVSVLQRSDPEFVKYLEFKDILEALLDRI
ncbi:hypothetical protein Hanom_Chr03g00265791 [Helianthus anomalus]